MDDFSLIEQSISNHFPILGFFNGQESKDSYFIVGHYDQQTFQDLISELDGYGFVPFINPDGNYYKINIAKKPEKSHSRVHFNVILLIATICTTIFAGYFYSAQGNIYGAIAFAVALLGIIGAHEFAHYFAARKHGVHATLPYFIPAPTMIGTFGALINIKSPIPDRNALFDLGFSGPLAGFLVAIPVLAIGLHYSAILTTQNVDMMFPDPLIIKIISFMVIPGYTFNTDVVVHPVAFAGWVGILVTMLNLMPVAFLDGGHISRSLFSQKTHQTVSIVGIILTIVLGWFFMALLMGFIFLRGKNHPGALDNVTPVTKNRKIIAVFILAIFILSLSVSPTLF